MRRIETQLRAGMARNGIDGDAADGIVRSITSFALYGFPESHAASFALIVYASAYLKAHYPAAFYTALLNNQPMGFYHPATLVKDAQRRGVRFASIDVQRVGLDVSGGAGRTHSPGADVRARPARGGRPADRIGAAARRAARPVASAARVPGAARPTRRCSSVSRSEATTSAGSATCARGRGGWRSSRRGSARWTTSSARPERAATSCRRWRRSARSTRSVTTGAGALWQIERAVRPAGELYEEEESPAAYGLPPAGPQPSAVGLSLQPSASAPAPLSSPMGRRLP